MDDRKKWVLKSGKVVEDEIFQYGLQCQFEHAFHSFIINPTDSVWKKRFTANELKEISEHNTHSSPPCSDQLRNYLNTFTELKPLEALVEQTREFDYDFDGEFDLDWVQFSIRLALRLFQGNYFPLTDQTEVDLIRRIWSFINTAFDTVKMDIRTGQMEICASSARKRHGHRTDFLFNRGQGELGHAEVGKKDEGDKGNQMCQLAKVTPQHRHKLVVVGFIMMVLKLRALVLDRPTAYVCRCQHTPSLFFPDTEETIGSKLGALLAPIIQVKRLVCKTLRVINTSKPIDNQNFENAVVFITSEFKL
ncbi:hypothetical protein DFQ30_002753 [Apophysomyces sp. BC1015]|nr:hypothetical protein DFQ30_002753 [Apophysomyces sp. BC1015]